jgi:hypothetical protein
VVLAVVMGAEGDEVPGFGGPAVLPVEDVVDVQPGSLLASEHPASAVAVLDGGSGLRVDDPGLGAEAHQPPGALLVGIVQGEANGAVAGQVR